MIFRCLAITWWPELTVWVSNCRDRQPSQFAVHCWLSRVVQRLVWPWTLRWYALIHLVAEVLCNLQSIEESLNIKVHVNPWELVFEHRFQLSLKTQKFALDVPLLRSATSAARWQSMVIASSNTANHNTSIAHSWWGVVRKSHQCWGQAQRGEAWAIPSHLLREVRNRELRVVMI